MKGPLGEAPCGDCFLCWALKGPGPGSFFQSWIPWDLAARALTPPGEGQQRLAASSSSLQRELKAPGRCLCSPRQRLGWSEVTAWPAELVAGIDYSTRDPHGPAASSVPLDGCRRALPGAGNGAHSHPQSWSLVRVGPGPMEAVPRGSQEPGEPGCPPGQQGGGWVAWRTPEPT